MKFKGEKIWDYKIGETLKRNKNQVRPGVRPSPENSALYPPGWTHRAYFAPRGERNKRLKEGGGGEALLQEDTVREQERTGLMSEELVAARMEEGAAASAVEPAHP